MLCVLPLGLCQNNFVCIAVDHIPEQINVKNYLVKGNKLLGERIEQRISKASITSKSLINWNLRQIIWVCPRKQKIWNAVNKKQTANPKYPLIFHHSLNLPAMTTQAVM